MSIAVCIATYGEEKWAVLAEARAAPSAIRQTKVPSEIILHHGDSLHEARNTAASKAKSDWLCFLDADDQLDAGYIEAMERTASRFNRFPALIQPSTIGVYPDGTTDPAPILIPTKPLLDGNYMVIGTLIRRDQFERVGGFKEWPVYEDWDLWLRAWRDGARLAASPLAIYRVHVNPESRNNCERKVAEETFVAIRAQYIRKMRHR